jgi:hypothetical protein
MMSIWWEYVPHVLWLQCGTIGSLRNDWSIAGRTIAERLEYSRLLVYCRIIYCWKSTITQFLTDVVFLYIINTPLKSGPKACVRLYAFDVSPPLRGSPQPTGPNGLILIII